MNTAQHGSGADPFLLGQALGKAGQALFLAELSRRGFGNVVNGHIGTQRCQPRCDGPAKPAARSGDQGDRPRETGPIDP